MKYAWIKAQQNQQAFNVNAMCEMLGVMRSGYYAWKNNPQSTRDKEDIRLGGLIKKSFYEGRNTYGRKRIQDDLKDWGEKISKRRIGKMKLELWIYGVKHAKNSKPLRIQSTMSIYRPTY